MAEYEVLIERINPCGGDTHPKREMIDVETDDPVAYVRANSPFEITDVTEGANGETIVTTVNGGYMAKYYFSK
ncbi:MAG: hypothetical protein HUJ65_00855 [Oscillospiraceae bacterium]|nr:hypothetical protein [Oscillospiraceae bacterium]